MEYPLLMQSNEIRRALAQLRAGRVWEAQATLEGMLLADDLAWRWWRRDPVALRMSAAYWEPMEWAWTPAGRLEYEHLRSMGWMTPQMVAWERRMEQRCAEWEKLWQERWEKLEEQQREIQAQE